MYIVCFTLFIYTNENVSIILLVLVLISNTSLCIDTLALSKRTKPDCSSTKNKPEKGLKHPLQKELEQSHITMIKYKYRIYVSERKVFQGWI